MNFMRKIIKISSFIKLNITEKILEIRTLFEHGHINKSTAFEKVAN